MLIASGKVQTAASQSCSDVPASLVTFEWICRLVKAGLLDKKYAKRFSTISAWAELIGYFGNVTLNALRIAAALERELMLTQELVRRKKVCMQTHISFHGIVCAFASRAAYQH